jgi:hypothetical protein
MEEVVVACWMNYPAVRLRELWKSAKTPVRVASDQHIEFRDLEHYLYTDTFGESSVTSLVECSVSQLVSCCMDFSVVTARSLAVPASNVSC